MKTSMEKDYNNSDVIVFNETPELNSSMYNRSVSVKGV